MCMYVCIYIFYTLLALILRKTRIFKFFKISEPDPDPDLKFRIRIRIRLWSRIRSFSDPNFRIRIRTRRIRIRSDPDPGKSDPCGALDGTISRPELTATNSTLWGIISLAQFCTTRSPSSTQSGNSEPDVHQPPFLGPYLLEWLAGRLPP